MSISVIGLVLGAFAVIMIAAGVGILVLFPVYERFYHEVETETSAVRDRAMVSMPISGHDYVARDPSSSIVETGETEEQAIDRLVEAVQRKYG